MTKAELERAATEQKEGLAVEQSLETDVVTLAADVANEADQRREEIVSLEQMMVDMGGELDDETREMMQGQIDALRLELAALDGSHEEARTSEALPAALRGALEQDSKIAYANYGEEKVVSVVLDGKTHEFRRPSSLQDEPAWTMTTLDDSGRWMDTASLNEDADVEYLEALFKQDLPERFRNALRDQRTLTREEYGERKVISIVDGGKTYEFRPPNDLDEYPSWTMTTIDEDGKWLESVNLREDADQAFLDELNKKDVTDGVRDALREHGVVTEDAEGKLLSIQQDGKTYEFRPPNDLDEYPSWTMTTIDERGRVDSVSLREEDDEKFLESFLNR